MSDPASGFEGTERFALRRPIGSGGFGAVYEAYDRERHELVALKVLHATDPSDLYRFKREFRFLCDIAHPNLITLYELFTEPGPRGLTWFFTMELLDGTSFIEHVCPPPPGQPARRAPSSQPASGQLPSGRDSSSSLAPYHEGRLRSTLKQLCEGLAVLHQAGMLHRDIKPSNVRVTSQGRVVLLDFGVVRSLSSIGSEISILGTPAYMSPEQGMGEPLSQASDWYSVGVVLYQALAGHLPHTGGPWAIIKAKVEHEAVPPTHYRQGIPADLLQLCIDLLRRRPEDRPPHGEILRRVGARPVGHRALSLAAPGARSGETATRQLVGRATQLVLLRERFALLRRERQPQVVLLHGTSGMGKSAIVRAFLDELTADGAAQVIEGRCFERESVPYRAVDGMVDAMGRHLRGMSPEELAPLLPGHLFSLTRLFPVLRSVAGIEQAVTSEAQLADPQEIRRRAFGALRTLLQRLGGRHPLVLFIDDLHWIDLDSVSLLCELLLPPHAPAVLLCGAYRSEDAAASQALGSLLGLLGAAGPGLTLTQVEIGPLLPADCEQLASELLREEGADDGVAADPLVEGKGLVAAAGGSPFFIEELCRYVRTTASLGALDASKSGLPGGAAAGQQAALDEVILARLSRLPQAARRLVEVLAVAGRPLQRIVAGRTAGLQPAGVGSPEGTPPPTGAMVRGSPALASYPSVAAAPSQSQSGPWARGSSVPPPVMNEPTVVAILRSARMLRTTAHAGKEMLELYHHRLREAVLKSLSPRARIRLHEALALALESTDRPDPETLMMHFYGAGQRDRAAHFAARAAQRAADNLAFEHSARLYRFALEQRAAGDDEADTQQEGHEIRGQLAEVLAHAGRAGEAAELYLLAATGQQGSWAIEMRRRAAEQLLRTGRIDEGQAVLREVVEAVGLRMPGAGETLLSLMLIRARVRLSGLKLAPVQEGQRPTLSERDFLRMNVCWTANLGLGLVDTLRAAHFEGRYVLLALRSGDPYRATLALCAEHIFSSLLGPKNDERCRLLLERATALGERTTHPHAAAWLVAARGMSSFLTGRFAPALEALDRAEQAFRTECSGAMWERASSQLYSLQALTYLGELGELATRLPSRLHEADDRGDLFAATTLRTAILPWALIAADDPGKAREEARAAMRRWSKEGVHLQHFFYISAMSSLDLYEGQPAQALRRVQRSWPSFKRWFLMRSHIRRVAMLDLRARCSLAVAARDATRRSSLVSAALADARRLEKEGAAWASGLAGLVRAGAASLQRRQDQAAAHLDAALLHLDEARMALHAAAVRQRQAQLGVRSGVAAMAPGMEPATFFRLQGIRNPDRLIALLTPGFG